MSDILAVIRMNLLKLFNCGTEMILIVAALVCVIGYTSGISAVFVAVSYTHLDVYKRQLPPQSAGH